MKKLILLILISLQFPTNGNNFFNSTLNEISRLEKQGKYKQIDSLYALLDINNIPSYDLMNWAEVKFILGDASSAGNLYCKAEEERTKFLIRNSFKTNLKDLSDLKSSEEALKSYFECKKSTENRVQYTDWLIHIVSSLNFHSLELELIDSLYLGKKEYTDELTSSAIKRLSKGLGKECLQASFKALNSTTEESKKRVISSLIFKSYLLTGNNDSAFVWLNSAQLNRISEITDAIVICQKTLNLSIADSIITLLPENITKDTLIIRNQIFKDNFESAFKKLDQMKQKYKSSYFDIMLFWDATLNLYSGKTENFTKVVNSPKVNNLSFNNQFKTIFLSWKAAISVLKDDPGAIKTYGIIEKLNYTQNYKPFNPFLNNPGLSNSIKEYLLSIYLKGIVNSENYQTATNLINEIPKETKNEELSFYRGIIKIHTGFAEDGKKELENLILNGKGSLFSQKARIYLLENFSGN